ncbi:hypothetical protein B0H11DRAFT_1944506 [Mycena galericulata]|nr:hypothetical protein B0H11DRAFT_1944506 [Mycena galericulata]
MPNAVSARRRRQLLSSSLLWRPLLAAPLLGWGGWLHIGDIAKRSHLESRREKGRLRMREVRKYITEEQREKHRQAQQRYRERQRERARYAAAKEARRATMKRTSEARKETKVLPRQTTRMRTSDDGDGFNVDLVYIRMCTLVALRKKPGLLTHEFRLMPHLSGVPFRSRRPSLSFDAPALLVFLRHLGHSSHPIPGGITTSWDIDPSAARPPAGCRGARASWCARRVQSPVGILRRSGGGRGDSVLVKPAIEMKWFLKRGADG